MIVCIVLVAVAVWFAVALDGIMVLHPPKLPAPKPDHERMHALEVECEIHDESGELIK